jgi:hypothetical protein
MDKNEKTSKKAKLEEALRQNLLRRKRSTKENSEESDPAIGMSWKNNNKEGG